MQNVSTRFATIVAGALFIGGILITSEALAAATNFSGKIEKVHLRNDGKGLIYFVGGDVSGAACRDAGMGNALAFNVNTDAGKALMQLALAAHLADKSVNAIGTNSCTIIAGASVADAEDLDRMYVY